MSTSITEEDSGTEITESPTVTETFDILPFTQSMNPSSEELETLLEKQLIHEKTRVDQLTNDNQRFLSQNIDLCRAIRRQKSEMNNLQTRNAQLEQQVAKLFLTVRTLSKTQKEKSVTDAELQKSLKHEFSVLKDAIVQKDDQIITLENANKKLSYCLNTNTKEINNKSNKLCELNDTLQQINHKYETEKNQYEQTIKTHLESMNEFNETIDALQSAMTTKEKEINVIKSKNNELQKLLKQKDDKIKNIVSDNDEKIKQIEQQTVEIANLKHIKNLYTEYEEKMKGNEEKYQDICKEREWWKSEARILEKECQLNMNKIRALKCELNSNSEINSNWRQNDENNNITVLKKKCYYLYWKRFVEYVVYEYGRGQMFDALRYLKVQYMKLNVNNEINGKVNMKECFKISMYKSLKDVKKLDVDKMLLCEDTKELKHVLTSSNMSHQLQLKVAAQLLPVVENYRMSLQKDINIKIDKMINKFDETQSNQII
eukprot:394624_1